MARPVTCIRYLDMWVSTLLQRRKVGPLTGDCDRKNSGEYCYGSVHSKGVDSCRFSAGCRISGGSSNLSGGGRLSSCDGLSGGDEFSVGSRFSNGVRLPNDDLSLSNGGGSFPDNDCLSGGGDRKGGREVNLDWDDARISISQRREVDCDSGTNHSPARCRHSTLRNVSNQLGMKGLNSFTVFLLESEVFIG